MTTSHATSSPDIPGLSLRPAADSDWDAIARVLNRANTADGIEEIRTGEALRRQYEPRDRFQLGRDVLVAEIDGELVAFAMGIRTVRDGILVGETSGAVVPEHRRRGLGTALWQATRDRLAAEMAEDPRPGGRQLRTWAQDLQSADRALLTAQGYISIRFGFEMRRFLGGVLPEHPLPDGIELRPVVPDQHRSIFEADDEAFRDHWGHREATEGDFRAIFEDPDTDTSLWCVAWDGDQVAGVVMNTIYREENEQLGVRRGWLDRVSVRRPWRGRGVGKALCAASLGALRERGMDEAWLGVDGSNPTGALQLYEHVGFHVARRWQVWGRPVDGPAPAGWQAGG